MFPEEVSSRLATYHALSRSIDRVWVTAYRCFKNIPCDSDWGWKPNGCTFSGDVGVPCGVVILWLDTDNVWLVFCY